MLVYHMLLCGSIILCPIYSFYLNEKLNLIKKSKSTVTRPDMIDYELCKIQFMEEKMSRIYNALIELVAAAVFIIPLWGIYEKFFFQSWKRTMVYMIFGFYLAVVPDQDEPERYGVCRCSETGAGSRLCGKRSDR